MIVLFFMLALIACFMIFKKQWKKTTPIVLLVICLAILSACGTKNATEEVQADKKVTQKTESAKKNVTPPKIESKDQFKSTNNGTVIIKGKTAPNAEVRVESKDFTAQKITTAKNGEFAFTIPAIKKAKVNATIYTKLGNKEDHQVISLVGNPTYKKTLAKKVEDERLAKEKKTQLATETRKVAQNDQKQVKVQPSKKTTVKKTVVPSKKAQPKPKPAKPKPKPTKPSQAQGSTVYITATGKKYHFSPNCRGLNHSNSKTKIKLKDAQSRGYTKCSFE
ncbi:DUF4198 domain-containing protein [Listeria sp. PSOL-1]|uniref:DUF4198 domain-containing protein n=1 Tax=Listeria sp. PSOL-1 TaxID=1844999 RepID=UPI0013D5C152|nr:DUF4198 domain-containing protein [Listeria sp. PSOL-1]